MGRGGSGGGHASGGGHSHGGGSHGSSHSHGGGRGSGGYRPSYRDYHSSGGYHPYHRRSYGPGGFGPIRMGGPGSPRGCLNSFLALFLVVALLAAFSFFAQGDGKDIAASTIPREPVQSGNAYISDCIIDEIGWIDNEASLSRDLKVFTRKPAASPTWS